MSSVENLVMDSMQIKFTRSSRKWKIVAAIAGIVAVVMTVLFLWQVLKDGKQCDSKRNDNNGGNTGGKEAETRSEPGRYDRPCPRQPINPLPLLKPYPEKLISGLKKVEDYFSSRINKTMQLPAISVNVFHQNRTLWSHHYGTKVAKHEDYSPNDQTVYRIGSVTKVFVVLMVYKFYEDGLIDSLDDPLSKYAPGFYIQNPYTGTNVTIRQIASQMAGLPREAPCFYICRNDTSSEQLRLLRNRSLVLPPGTMPSYSNLGYALLGRLLSENLLQNQTFESWVTERILIPLNMTRTGFEITADVQQNMAFPYLKDGTKMPFMNIYWVAPAGQMYSTLEDMTKLGIMFVQPSKQTLFRPASLWEMMSPVNVAPDEFTLWGSPWEMELQEHFVVRRKGGRIDSYAGFLSVVPELQLGVNLLISTGYFVKGDTGRMIHDVYEILLPLVNQTLIDLESSRKFPFDPKPYIGSYTLNITDVISLKILTYSVQVTVEDDKLKVHFVDGRRQEFRVVYIGNKLLFQARFARPFASCLSERLGSFEDFHFFPFDKNDVSTGFEVPGQAMVATRIS